MLKWLIKLSPSQVNLVKLGFELDNKKGQSEHLQSIANTFALGFNDALYNDVKKITSLQFSKKGFYFEGATMACAVIDGINFLQSKPLCTLSRIKEKPEFSYLQHVGIGWAFAKIPWLRTQIFKHLHPIHRWLAFDGWGFHDAFFKTKKTLNFKLPNNLSKEEQDIYVQGIGRALWFVKGSNIDAITLFISSSDVKYQAALWSGVGLAAVYAGYDYIDEDMLNSLRKHSGQYLFNFQQGCAFGATASKIGDTATEYTSTACRVFTNKTVDELSALCIAFEQSLPLNGSTETYQLWRTSITQTLKEEHNNVATIKI